MKMIAVLAALVLVPSPAPRGEVKDLRIVTDRTVDASSLESIVRDVVARAGARTDDEKAIAIYEYLHRTIFHHAYATEKKPQSVGPLKVIHVYGWALCGGQHTVLKALYEAAGWECRYVGWPGHTTIEVKYGGRWHYFDTFLKCWYWSKDKTHVASQEEIANDPSIVLDAVKDGRAAKENLCCGDEPQGVVDGCKARKVVGDSKGWASVTWRDENWSPALDLPSGAALRLDWKGEPAGYAAEREPKHSCGTKDYRQDPVLGPVLEHYGTRAWSNGEIVYAPEPAAVKAEGAMLKDGRYEAASGAGVLVFGLRLPYPWVRGTASAEGEARWSVSVDGGRTWTPAPGGELGAAVKQAYDVRVKAEFAGALGKPRITGLVEHNRSALPHLLPGKNRITVSAKEGPGADQVLVVTYAWQEATAPGSRKRWDGNGVSYGEPKTVSKEIRSLPFTFEIEVGGTTPPKMLSLGREVRSR